MNSDFSNLPPEERAQLLTALLLGELPPAEADALRGALTADPELAREHTRLQQTIALVRETAAMERKTSAGGTPLRLDDKRREKLLAAFKTPAPQPVTPRRPRNLQFLPLALAAALVGLLIVSVMLPSLAGLKSRAERLTPLSVPVQSLVDFDSDRYEAVPDRLSARVRAARPVRRESERDFAESLSLSAPESTAAKVQFATPAPKIPAVALVLPMVKDSDGGGSAPMLAGAKEDVQLQSLAETRGEQLFAKEMREDSKRPAVVRAETRADDYGLASGGSVEAKPSTANPVPARGFSSQLSTPTITTASGRLPTTPVLEGNYAITDLERSSTVPPASGPAALAKNLNLGETKMLGSIAAGFAPAPTSPPVEAPVLPAGSGSSDRTVRSANVANLYADVALVPESELEQKARFDSGGLAGGGSVTFQNQSGRPLQGNLSASPSVPSANAPKQDMTVADSQGIIEARRLQLSASGPATAGILPPTALGLEIKSAEPALAATKSYAEETRWREANGQQPLTVTGGSREKADVPATPLTDLDMNRSASGVDKKSVVSGGGGGMGGFGSGSARAGLVGGDARGSSGIGGGLAYRGVNIARGLRDEFLSHDSNSDGIAVTPSAPVSAPAGLGKVTDFDTAAYPPTPHPVNQSAQLGFELAANPTSAPEGMVDALEAIRKTPSTAGGSSASSRGESESKFYRLRAEGSPSSGGSVSVARSPAPESVQQAVRFADDGAALYINGSTVARTNALVSNQHWGRNAIHSAAEQGSYWFGNTAQDDVQWDFIAPISDGEKTESLEARLKYPGGDRWVSSDAGVAKDQPASVVDGRLGGIDAAVGRRLNGVVHRAGGATINDPEATRTVPGVPSTVPSSVRRFYDDNINTGPEAQSGKALGDVNGRVTVQLPALAGEPQLSRQSSPTRPAGERQSELAVETSGAVVAEPAPPNVAMTGITTLSDGSSDLVALLEKGNSKKEVVKQRSKLPAPAAFARTNRFVTRNASVVTNQTSMFDTLPESNVIRELAESERQRRLPAKPSASTPTPQPEVLTRDNAFSTFSLNVSDVSFKLAAASLEKGAMPDVATVRSEEFINAFDYRDPVPAAGVPLAFVSERARYPFAHNRDVLRFSVRTAAQGRDGGRPLNIVLLLDNSGSMERADRVRTIQEALRALAAQLQPQDKLSVVTFSRTPRLWADGVTGAQAAEVAGKIAALTPEGGTNLEEALDLAYRTALRHYAATAMNRVVLLTDGAANLGNVEPAALKVKVESFRKQGVALDCFGIGWEGFNDDLLENLSRNGDGRYGFVNTPEEASTEFAAQLAGALRVAASDVKVQVEFNPKRVTAYRQVGYAKHQLTKQQFRDNTVDAAEISASEAGNALYIIETNPRGEGPVATVRARFRVPQTSDYREHEWVVPFGSAVELEQSGSALRLATSASAFSEWLAGSPFAGEVTTDRLLGLLSGVPEVYGADPRPKKLEWMIRQAKSISGK